MPRYSVNWHHRSIADVVDRMVNGESKRVMLFTAPRHGKSELVSRRMPAYILGRQPNSSVIAVSYSASLASSMNRDVQRIIDTPEYREVFPDTTLSSSNVRSSAQGTWLRNSDMFEVVGHRGMYISAGVNGPITGRGADWVIIDDPVKNRAEAESKTYRDSVFDWYASTLYSRLEPDARILITLTRWHEDDLAGRILANNPDDWEVITYPALAEATPSAADDRRSEGEPLWPGKYDLAALSDIKSTIGAYEWEALYQQSPSPPGGNIVDRDSLRYYTKPPPPQAFTQVIQSWDLAFTDKATSSYVVGQVWGRAGTDMYLLDQTREHLDFTATIAAMKDMTRRWPQATAKYVENKANGPAILSALSRSMPGLVPITPDGSKEARLWAVTPMFRAGNVRLPDRALAQWVTDYVEELVTFPAAKNDDQVDATTQALSVLTRSAHRTMASAEAF